VSKLTWLHSKHDEHVFPCIPFGMIPSRKYPTPDFQQGHAQFFVASPADSVAKAILSLSDLAAKTAAAWKASLPKNLRFLILLRFPSLPAELGCRLSRLQDQARPDFQRPYPARWSARGGPLPGGWGLRTRRSLRREFLMTYPPPPRGLRRGFPGSGCPTLHDRTRVVRIVHARSIQYQ
jgi:hypothetical protein